MDDLTTRAAKLLWSKLPHPQTCPDEIDAAARAVVKLVLDEARSEIIKHSNVARKKMSECYEQGNPENLDVWSSIVAHLDIAQEKIRALGGAVMSAPELLPCPFCGGKADGGFFPGDYDVSCEACEFSISRHISDCGGSEEKAKDSAIAAWNRRAALVPAQDSALAQEVE